MDTQIAYEVNSLSPALGAEVIGLDLREPLSADLVAELRALWMDSIVLVFRDQDLTMEQQKRFASCFGDLGERKRAPDALRERTEGIYQTDQHTLLVSNIVEDGKPIGAFGEGEMWMHIDSGYTERPYSFTFLFPIELPSRGGNTLFANTYMAYDSLSDEMKRFLKGKKALHLHEYRRSEKADISGDLSGKPHWFHPVCIRHPETGRKVLFVDRLMTSRIEGLSPEESDRVLEELYAHVENPDFVYEHVWRKGDFVMWDNRCSVHGRTWFPTEERRLLRRCTVEGVPLEE